MELELWQIVILIIAGGLVGISMSFIGQTGSGIVIPIVFLLTGDVLLAISVNILNDLLASSTTSINYIKNKNYEIRKDNFILIGVAAITTLFAVFILMTTDFSSAFGIILPIFFVGMGFIILKNGFPTTESLKRMVDNISKRFAKEETTDIEPSEENKTVNEKISEDNDIPQGLIPLGSRLFYILASVMGVWVGINAGIFGGSGGFVIALVLVILYGYALKPAVGTGLILSMIVCLMTFTIYQILGLAIRGTLYFDFQISFCLAIPSILVGVLASKYVQNLSAKAMGLGVGIVMIVLGATCLIITIIY